MNETIKTQSMPRLKPLVVGLAMSLAVASTAAFLAPQQAEAAAHHRHAAALNGAKVSTAQRADARAQVREFRHTKRNKGNLQPHSGRPAAVTAVTSCADDGSAGTLRYEVTNAVDGDTVDLSALTCSTISLATGEIEVPVDNLTIVGPGASALTIDAGGSSRAFYHDTSYGGTLTLRNVTVANGYYFDDYLLASGGCINSTGSVVLDGATVSNCKAVGKYSGGGAVYASDDITLTNSTISGNQSIGNATKYSDYKYGPQPGGQGGGLYAGGAVTVSKSTITGNSGILDNGAPNFNRGGGIFAFGAITVTDSTIDNNSIQGNGEGGLGGGIFANDEYSVLTVTNSTISGNTANMAGGGVIDFGGVNLSNSTVAFNAISGGTTALPNGSSGGLGGGGILDLHYDYGETTFNSSIVANNGNAGAYWDADFGSYGAPVGGANNLVIAASGENLPADTIADDPQLGGLGNNGGSTRTHLPASGSPVVGAGNNVAGLTNDQRGDGFPRLTNGAADIGSVQAGGDAAEQVPIPTLSTWAMALMAGLLGLLGWRRGNARTRR